MKPSLDEKVRELLARPPRPLFGGGGVGGFWARHLDPFFGGEGFARTGTDYRRARDRCIQHVFFRFDIEDVPEGRCYYSANLEFPELEEALNLGRRDEDDVNTVGKQMGYLGKHPAFEEWPIAKRKDGSELGRRVA